MFRMKPGNSSFFFTCSRIGETPSGLRVFLLNSDLPPNQDGNPRHIAGFPLAGRIALATQSRIHFSSAWLIRLPGIVDGSGVDWTLSRDITGTVPSYPLCPVRVSWPRLPGKRKPLQPPGR